MERDDILIALTRLQATQEAILDRFDEHKQEQKDMHVINTARMDAIENDISSLKEKVNYAAGFVAFAALLLGFCLEWIKGKLGISS